MYGPVSTAVMVWVPTQALLATCSGTAGVVSLHSLHLTYAALPPQTDSEREMGDEAAASNL